MSDTRWTETEGREVVRRWRRSGQSMSEFAREQGLDVQRICYWRKRLESGAPEQGRRGAAARVAGGDSKLVPGVVIGVRNGAAVSVQLCRGVVVEAESAAAIEPEWLAELQRALEQAP
ncbi:MAG: IS66 family insertion sequence element accessory protein TnpA [Pseudonocardiaceae bacterium]